MRQTSNCTILMLALTLAACGHGKAAEDHEAVASQAHAPTQTPAPAAAVAAPGPAANAARPLQAGDLDAYAKGMQKEIQVRQEASDRAAKAKAANDQSAETSALFELTSVDVTRAGAQAAGVDPARYDVIKNTVDRVLSTVDMNAMMARMGDAAQAQKFQHDPYASLDPAFAAALKSRQDELAKLRAQNMEILANARNL